MTAPTTSYEGEERQAVQQEHQLLPQTFDPPHALVGGTVAIGDQDLSWSIWGGQRMRRHFALDTETTLIADHTPPQLAMVSVSDGIEHYILAPNQLAEFLEQHLPYGHEMICHNVAFDFWVLNHYLRDTGSDVARGWLWSAADQARLHDTMLLAGLVSLAESDDDCLPSLADAVRRYCGHQLKKDAFRLRYAETILTDWGAALDPGFFQYAVLDAITTYQLYCRLTAAARRITDFAGTSRQYGFLTEAIQVKAAIALAAVTRNGIHLDLDRANELREDLDRSIQESLATMVDNVGLGLLHRHARNGKPKINSSTGLPRIDTRRLTDQLQKALPGVDIPTTATGKITTSVKEFWNQYREEHPLIEAYCGYTEMTKLRTFLTKLDKPVIHPRYRVFVRSGRTSCSSPNIQQLPRGSNIRDIVIASPDNLLLIIDYSALELRTLAAVCYDRYGFSKLRDVLKAGIDPHSYTAAMFAGLNLDEFKQLPNAKQLRQQAKAISFGVPGGLGVSSLVNYAKATYGVTLTQEQAAEFRNKLTEKVYPELKLYLSEDSATVLANTLRADVRDVRRTWPRSYHYGMLKKITEGDTHKADGTTYTHQTVERVWKQLEKLNHNPDLAAAINSRDTSATSPLRKLMFTPVSTPTGRVRGGVSFTAARNSPFQGLAADGAKLAMWNLVKAGYRVVAFVHDEFVIELAKLDDCTAAAKHVDQICCNAMQQLVGDIPISCEYALAKRWYKQAEAVFDESGQLQEWRP